MTVHYDSNVAIALLNGFADFRNRHDDLIARGEQVCFSSIVVFELWFGVSKSQRYAENAAMLRKLLSVIDVLPFSAEEAQASAEIRATLFAAGTPIGPYDLLIAAHAVRRGATLITANTREFSKAPGLIWEDWSLA